MFGDNDMKNLTGCLWGIYGATALKKPIRVELKQQIAWGKRTVQNLTLTSVVSCGVVQHGQGKRGPFQTMANRRRAIPRAHTLEHDKGHAAGCPFK
jgi:hypothetical protein